MGRLNGSSGTYLGAGWVLAPVHVGAGNVDFNGTTFPYDGTSVQLTNSDGTGADMLMFHLGVLPPLPKMPLTTSTPVNSSQVDMIGFGYIAGSVQTNFGTTTGFYWSSAQYKSWGNNKMISTLSSVNDGYGINVSFSTDFNSPPLQTSDEAQATFGDSGGGVFQKSGSTWQMVGMMFAIGTLSGQPANTSVYGDQTACANIATYRSEILSIIAGTVPTLTISRSGTNVLICWPDTGVSYKLVANTNLVMTNWVVLSPTLTATNSLLCAQLPATNRATFYRLEK